MGKMDIKFPNNLVKVLGNASANGHQMFYDMVKSGQDVIYKNVMKNIPSSLKKSNFSNNIKKTGIYYTKDGSLNGGVVITGYFVNKKGVTTPAPLVANMFEYGSNIHHYPKHPFVRKSLNKKEILNAAIKEQDKYLS